MTKLGYGTAEQRARWGELLQADASRREATATASPASTFRSVGVRFYQNGKLIGPSTIASSRGRSSASGSTRARPSPRCASAAREIEPVEPRTRSAARSTAGRRPLASRTVSTLLLPTACSACRSPWPRCRCTCTCPKFYGDHLGVDLALLGVVLLVLRLADGILDPAARRPSRSAPARASAGSRSRRPSSRSAWSRCSCRCRVRDRSRCSSGSPSRWRSSTSRSASRRSITTRGAPNSRSDPVERTRITAVREGLRSFGVVIAARAAVVPRWRRRRAWPLCATLRRVHRWSVRAGHAAGHAAPSASARTAREPNASFRGIDRATAGRSAVPPAARRVHAQRHRLSRPGDARALLHRRRSRRRSPARAVPRALLHRRRQPACRFG